MVQVLIFDTEAKAKKELQAYFDHNSYLLKRIDLQLEKRVRFYEQTPEFARIRIEQKNPHLTEEEQGKLLAGLGQGQTLTTVLRLYVTGNEYRCGGDFSKLELSYNVGPYHTIEKFIENIYKLKKKHRKAILESRLGLRNDSVFFTVREPYFFTNQEKESIPILEHSFARGFTVEEIRMFERNYGLRLPN